jgi:V/A-type H+-transporting ATPase subunit C
MPVPDLAVVHVNARVRGLRSQLFRRQDIEDMLDQPNLGTLVELLLNSPYQSHLSEALARFNGADAIEAAVVGHMLETYRRIISWSQGPLGELVRLYLTRWDLSSIKALLRYQHAHTAMSVEEAQVYAGPSLTGPVIQRFSEADSMESLVSRLMLWRPELCDVLAACLPAYEEQNDLAVMENALDYQYYIGTVHRLEAVHDADHQLVVQALRMEIDRVNLRLVFLRRRGETNLLLLRLLPEGTLPPSLLRRMAAAPDAPEAMAMLEGTLYRDLVEGLYQFMQTHRVSPLDRMFDQFILRRLRRMARDHVLSVAVVLSYIWLKYNEVINIRLIARGHLRHLPRGRVHEEVIHA